MSETITAGAAGGVEVTVWHHGEARATRALTGLFDVVVIDAARFRLVPTCALAKSLLSAWLGGELRRSQTMQQEAGPLTGSDWRYGRGTQFMEFEHSTAPMLCSGDDPYHTGMTLKPGEYEIARAAIEKSRRNPKDTAAGRSATAPVVAGLSGPVKPKPTPPSVRKRGAR